MAHTGEFDLIERISARFDPAPEVTGIGDDCAVIPQKSGLDTLVTTDLLIEDRHFLLGDISPEDLGWKSAAVNVSDIAAMGGKAESAFLSIALPPGTAAQWVDAFIGGFKALSDRCGVVLLGGDTSASPDKLFINITLLGSCPHGKAVRRSGAREGDLVCVTGPLGDSAGGLKLILERSARARSEASDPLLPSSGDACETLIRRHYRPEPKIAEGQRLAALAGLHAMMDISDGIASDLRHILKASGVSAEINLSDIPLSAELLSICRSRGWDAGELAVSGGEDYELLFTMAPGTEPDIPYWPIGRIVRGNEGNIRWIGGNKTEYQGFTHF